MTWQARRRFGLRERSRSSLLLPLLPTTTPSRVLHAAPRSRLRASSRTALAAADLPAECRQLGHRSVKSCVLHADRGASCSSPRGCQANPPACTLPIDASTTTLHNRPQRLFFAVQFCCVCAPRVCVLRVFTNRDTHRPAAPHAADRWVSFSVLMKKRRGARNYVAHYDLLFAPARTQCTMVGLVDFRILCM